MIVQQVLSTDPDSSQSHVDSAGRMCLSLADYCLIWVELPMGRFYWPPLVRSVSAASCVWAANKTGVTATYISSSSQDPASGNRIPGEWWSIRKESGVWMYWSIGKPMSLTWRMYDHIWMQFHTKWESWSKLTGGMADFRRQQSIPGDGALQALLCFMLSKLRRINRLCLEFRRWSLP